MSRRSRIAALLSAPSRVLIELGRRTRVNESIGRAVDSSVDRALQSEAVERAATKVLDSELVDRLWQRVLESEEAQQLVVRVADAPEVRQAITRQGVGLLEDLRGGLRRAARRLDTGAERIARALLRRAPREERSIYAGAVTRIAALTLDAAAVNAALLLVSAAIALVISALTPGDQSAGGEAIALGALAWLTIAGAYLSLFWGLAGRTLGMAFLGLRLMSIDGQDLTAGQAIRRLIGFAVSALCLMLGFLGILLEPRRRGWHDRYAGTVVLYADPELDRETKQIGAGPAAGAPGGADASAP
ncbi:MAG: RDD family protein [Solirubrobacterales bacterium]